MPTFLFRKNVRKKWKKYGKLEDAVLVKIEAIPDGTTDTKGAPTKSTRKNGFTGFEVLHSLPVDVVTYAMQ